MSFDEERLDSEPDFLELEAEEDPDDYDERRLSEQVINDMRGVSGKMVLKVIEVRDPNGGTRLVFGMQGPSASIVGDPYNPSFYGGHVGTNHSRGANFTSSYLVE